MSITQTMAGSKVADLLEVAARGRLAEPSTESLVVCPPCGLVVDPGSRYVPPNFMCVCPSGDRWRRDQVAGQS